MTFPNTPANFLTTGAPPVGGPHPLGLIELTGLQAGRYVLVETTPPPGHVAYPHPIMFEIVPGAPPAGNVVNDVRTVEVLNTPIPQNGFELPLTGGAGTLLFTVIGLALIAGSVVLLVAMRRRSK